MSLFGATLATTSRTLKPIDSPLPWALCQMQSGSPLLLPPISRAFVSKTWTPGTAPLRAPEALLRDLLHLPRRVAPGALGIGRVPVLGCWLKGKPLKDTRKPHHVGGSSKSHPHGYEIQWI